MDPDVFISHASEDKDEIARPLAEGLRSRGFRVWYDEYVLEVGDGLRRGIDRGLASCRYGVVILSKHFFQKEWPQKELDGLVAREVEQGTKLILPVWHGVSRADIVAFSPPLADKVGANTAEGISAVTDKITKVLREIPAPDPSKRVPLVQDFSLFDAEKKGCPECGGKIVITSMASESGECAIGTCQQCGWEEYSP